MKFLKNRYVFIMSIVLLVGMICLLIWMVTKSANIESTIFLFIIFLSPAILLLILGNQKIHINEKFIGIGVGPWIFSKVMWSDIKQVGVMRCNIATAPVEKYAYASKRFVTDEEAESGELYNSLLKYFSKEKKNLIFFQYNEETYNYVIEMYNKCENAID